jgi:hypothetical protein
MELTNNEIANAKVSLDRLCQEKLPIQIAWELAKISNILAKPIDVFVRVRQGLFARYEIKQEQKDGQVILTSGAGRMEEFAKEFEELLDLTTEIMVAKVKLPDTLEIEPATLVALERFVEV